MRKILVDLVLLGIAVGLTVDVIKGAIPYLPVIWFCLTVYYVRETLVSGRALWILSRFKARFIGKQLMYSYIAVAFFTGGLAVIYWHALTSFFAPRIAAYQSEQRNKSSIEPATEIPQTRTEKLSFESSYDIYAGDLPIPITKGPKIPILVFREDKTAGINWCQNTYDEPWFWPTRKKRKLVQIFQAINIANHSTRQIFNLRTSVAIEFRPPSFI